MIQTRKLKGNIRKYDSVDQWQTAFVQETVIWISVFEFTILHIKTEITPCCNFLTGISFNTYFIASLNHVFFNAKSLLPASDN